MTDDSPQARRDGDHSQAPGQLSATATQVLAEHGIDILSVSQQGSESDRAALPAAAETVLKENGIQLAPIEHETLKYHLLGPSLTKAGQDSVDQQKVSEIIYNASKGSKFFNNEEKKDKNLTARIDRILARKRQLDKLDLASDRRRADDYIAELELSRDLSQHVVHIDCDAFYAAVEELDRPELKEVPMAVGKGVLTTCNYHARKFGCRSGMAGFVAMKLCPQLICLPLNFAKYTAKAEEVRTILAEYDPRFESASIDEAYLNITEFCKEHDRDPEEVVLQLRAEVAEKTKITISAGIAANGRLAKICSNRNKPNGQFKIANDRTAIMAFMRDLSTRKVNGIGRVFERELDAIGVKTCGDIYEHRSQLAGLFGVKAFEFLMSVYLGMGRTVVQPAAEHERKSVGTESTFRDEGDREALRVRLRHTSEELEKDLARTRFKGSTLVLKVKMHTYEVFTRQKIPPKAINAPGALYNYSLPMLVQLEKERPGMKLRLMGLRVTNLVSTKKEDLDFFKLGRTNDSRRARATVDEDGWEVWPESEREDQAQNSESDSDAALARHQHGRERLPNPKPASASITQATAPAPEETPMVPCPICQRAQPADDRALNAHIDFCLSKQTIHEAVKDTAAVSPQLQPEPDMVANRGLHASSGNAAGVVGRKRGRPSSGSKTPRPGGIEAWASTSGRETGTRDDVVEGSRKRLFFAPD